MIDERNEVISEIKAEIQAERVLIRDRECSELVFLMSVTELRFSKNSAFINVFYVTQWVWKPAFELISLIFHFVSFMLWLFSC